MEIGIDEAGRGPLAGPVWVGAAVILDQQLDLSHFDDSKTLTEKRRETAYKIIKTYEQAGKLIIASSRSSAKTIEKLGIIRAQVQAMRRCIKHILCHSTLDAGSITTDILDPRSRLGGQMQILIDGNHTFGLEKSWTVETIIKGDQKIPAISIASIIAKVERDRYMIRQAKKYPLYGFEQHKGYGTAKHRDAIRTYGLSRIHRESFCRSTHE